MAQYLMTYHGGKQPSSPEEGQQHMQKFFDWLGELGDAAISPANPLSQTKTIASDGSVSDGGTYTKTMTGYTIVEAESMDAALEMAKSCPVLEAEGSLEVSEIMQMPGQG